MSEQWRGQNLRLGRVIGNVQPNCDGDAGLDVVSPSSVNINKDETIAMHS